MKKKLVFITARLPYPATSGRKNVMYNYCKILHEILGFEITVISFLEKDDDVKLKPSFIENVIALENVSGKQKMKNLLIKTLLTKKMPMQVALFYDPNIKKRIQEELKRINPAVVIADMVRTTEYAKDFLGYKIADLDDLISIRYERQMDMDMRSVNPYGAYLYTMPRVFQKILELNFLKRIILGNEIKLLKKYERSIAQKYDKTVFVAQHEADILNSELNFEKALGVPLGVDLEYFSKYFNKIDVEKNTIAFLGAMSVAHNEAGVIHFVENILPLIRKKVPDARFVVVGGGVTEKLRAYANDFIEFTGRVDDVRTAVGKYQVFVCPLTFGSGIKTKNLEAMAMGVPVVTTGIGAENINAVAGKDWIVEDDNQLFADAVVEIMKNKDLHDQLMTNGYLYVKNNFTWKVAEEKMKELFNEVEK